MPKHYNGSLGERAKRIFNFKQDALSSEVAPQIVAVVPITPRCDIVRFASSTVSGSQTAFTLPSDKDFYLVSIAYSIATDAASDLTTGAVGLTIDGVARSVCGMGKITLTAFTGQQSQTFNPPIKLDRGSTITLNGTFTVGTAIKAVSFAAYTEEVTQTGN